MTTLWHRLLHGTRKTHERVDWSYFAGDDWPDTIMNVDVTDHFHEKQGRATGRWLLDRNGHKLAVYLKRHYHLPWWHGLLATLWPTRTWSPGLQEAKHLTWAKDHGFAVPEVVATAEYIGPQGRLQSMLAIEELTDMLPLHEAIPLAAETLSPLAFRDWKRAVIDELARMSRALHQLRHFHKDLYLCHFYLPRDDIEQGPHRQTSLRGRLHMIDLHRLAKHRWTWPIWLVKDLGQLLFSADVEGITMRDRVRFWRQYRGGTKRTMTLRWLEWVVRVKGWRYRDHNRKMVRKPTPVEEREAA